MYCTISVPVTSHLVCISKLPYFHKLTPLSVYNLHTCAYTIICIHRNWLHLDTVVKPFLDWVLWMKLLHSNWNPQLILSYYLETISTLRCKSLILHLCYSVVYSQRLLVIPLITQSDLDTKNFSIANAYTILQHMSDLELLNMGHYYMQHHWIHTKKIISSEIA